MTKTNLIFVIGTVLTLVGFVLMFSPIPGSTMIMAGGMAMVLCTSPYTARCIQIAREKVSTFDRIMRWVETHTGQMIGEALIRTRPLGPDSEE